MQALPVKTDTSSDTSFPMKSVHDHGVCCMLTRYSLHVTQELYSTDTVLFVFHDARPNTYVLSDGGVS